MDPQENGHPHAHWIEKAPVPMNVEMNVVQEISTGKQLLAMTFNTQDLTATFFVPSEAVVKFAKDVERKAAECASGIVVPGPGIAHPE